MTPKPNPTTSPVQVGVTPVGPVDKSQADRIASSGTSQPPATVVYACSGCSDAGELADRIARRLTREGAAQMSCLAGIGGGVKSLVAKAESAERILVIDGCPLSCARHTLERAGFTEFEHLGLQSLGLRKGACEVNEPNIIAGIAAAKSLILKPTKG